jgi:hypothetical protein
MKSSRRLWAVFTWVVTLQSVAAQANLVIDEPPDADTTCIHNSIQQSSVSVDGLFRSGSFRRPFDPGVEIGGGVSTYGLKKMSGWIFQGSFVYNYSQQHNVWGVGVSDPNRTTPYIWADTSSGTWTRHLIDSRCRIASPLKKRRYFLFSLGYMAGQGARDTRPKPLFRLNRIDINPSFNFSAGAMNISAGVVYRYRREEDEMGGAYTSGNVLLYRLRGYGTFDKTSFISGVRYYNGHRVGMVTTVRTRSTHGVDAIFTGRFFVTTENVIEGIAEPTAAGLYKEWRGDARVIVVSSSSHNRPSLDLYYAIISGKGVDPAFNAVNTGLIRSEGKVKISSAFDSFIRSAHIIIDHRTDAIFDVVSTTDWTVRSAGLSGGARLVFNAWEFQTGVGYSHIYHKALSILRPTEISDTIVTPQFKYLSASFVDFRLGVAKTFNFTSGKELCFRLQNALIDPGNGNSFRFTIVPQLTLLM